MPERASRRAGAPGTRPLRPTPRTRRIYRPTPRPDVRIVPEVGGQPPQIKDPAAPGVRGVATTTVDPSRGRSEPPERILFVRWVEVLVAEADVDLQVEIGVFFHQLG